MDRNYVIRFKTKVMPKNKLNGGKTLYGAVIQGGKGTRNIRQTAEDLVAQGLTVDVMTVEHVLSFFAAHLPELMAKDGGSHRVLGDLATFFPVITGSLDSADAEFDPERNDVQIVAVTSKRLRHAMEGVTFVNVTKPVRAHVRGFEDEVFKRSGGPLALGATVHFVGNHLTTLPGQEGEGVWLIPEAGGKPVRMELKGSWPRLVDAVVPKDIPEGRYTLRLATRCGRTEEMALQTSEWQVDVRDRESGTMIDHVRTGNMEAVDVLVGMEPATIIGHNLMIRPAAAADEGVWLETLEGAKTGENFTIDRSDLDRLVVTPKAAVPPGRYQLVVATRGGKPAAGYVLQKAKKRVEVR